MSITIENFKNILGCCYYSRLCNVIAKFTVLRLYILENGITFPMSKNLKVTKWRYIHITDLNYCVNQINRNIYNDYIFTE